MTEQQQPQLHRTPTSFKGAWSKLTQPAMREQLEGLTAIELKSQRLSPADAAELAGVLIYCKNLRILDLSNNDNLGWNGFEQILKSLGDIQLQELSLQNTGLNGSIKVGSTQLHHLLGKLSVLDVSKNNLQEADLHALLLMLASTSTLTSLNISHNPGVGRAAKPIAELLLRSPSMSVLNFAKCGLTGEQAAVVLSAVSATHPHLKSLFIRGNDIGDVGAEAVAHVIHQCHSLQVVSMAQNGLTPLGYAQVAAAFCKAECIIEFGLVSERTYKSGDLDKVGAFCWLIGADLAGESSHQQWRANATQLDLSDMGLTRIEAHLLSKSLPECHALCHLNLSKNLIGDVGGAELAVCFAQSEIPLCSLDISDNELSTDSICELLHATRHFNTLKSINFSRNNVPASAIASIAQAVVASSSLREICVYGIEEPKRELRSLTEHGYELSFGSREANYVTLSFHGAPKSGKHCLFHALLGYQPFIARAGIKTALASQIEADLVQFADRSNPMFMTANYFGVGATFNRNEQLYRVLFHSDVFWAVDCATVVACEPQVHLIVFNASLPVDQIELDLRAQVYSLFAQLPLEGSYNVGFVGTHLQSVPLSALPAVKHRVAQIFHSFTDTFSERMQLLNSGSVFYVESSLSASPDLIALQACLNAFHASASRDYDGARSVPKTSRTVLSALKTIQEPWISFKAACEHVRHRTGDLLKRLDEDDARTVMPLQQLSNETILRVLRYLHNTRELYFQPHGPLGDFVVLDIGWLCERLIFAVSAPIGLHTSLAIDAHPLADQQACLRWFSLHCPEQGSVSKIVQHSPVSGHVLELQWCFSFLPPAMFFKQWSSSLFTLVGQSEQTNLRANIDSSITITIDDLHFTLEMSDAKVTMGIHSGSPLSLSRGYNLAIKTIQALQSITHIYPGLEYDIYLGRSGEVKTDAKRPLQSFEQVLEFIQRSTTPAATFEGCFGRLTSPGKTLHIMRE